MKIQDVNIKGSTRKRTTEKDLPYRDVPKFKEEAKSKGAKGGATFNFGKLDLKLGGEYDSTKRTESLPGNIYNIPSRKSKQIFRRLSSELGVKINDSNRIGLKINREKVGNMPSKQTGVSLNLSGKLKGGRFMLEATKAGNEKIGTASIRIPFSTGGKVHRGRRAEYEV